MPDVYHNSRTMRLDPNRPRTKEESSPHALAFSRDMDTLINMKKSELVSLASAHGVEVVGTGSGGSQTKADYIKAMSAT